MTDAEQIAVLRTIARLEPLLAEQKYFREADASCFKEVADERDELAVQLAECRRERDEYRAENAKMAKQLVKLTEGNALFAQVNEAIRKASKKRKGRR